MSSSSFGPNEPDWARPKKTSGKMRKGSHPSGHSHKHGTAAFSGGNAPTPFQPGHTAHHRPGENFQAVPTPQLRMAEFGHPEPNVLVQEARLTPYGDVASHIRLDPIEKVVEFTMDIPIKLDIHAKVQPGAQYSVARVSPDVIFAATQQYCASRFSEVRWDKQKFFDHLGSTLVTDLTGKVHTEYTPGLIFASANSMLNSHTLVDTKGDSVAIMTAAFGGGKCYNFGWSDECTAHELDAAKQRATLDIHMAHREYKGMWREQEKTFYVYPPNSPVVDYINKHPEHKNVSQIRKAQSTLIEVLAAHSIPPGHLILTVDASEMIKNQIYNNYGQRYSHELQRGLTIYMFSREATAEQISSFLSQRDEKHTLPALQQSVQTDVLITLQIYMKVPQLHDTDQQLNLSVPVL